MKINVSQQVPVKIHRFGGLVQAPMNCTTFLCRIFLQEPREVSKIRTDGTLFPKTGKIEETYNRFAAIKTMLGLNYNINRYIRMAIKMKKKNQTSKAVGQR